MNGRVVPIGSNVDRVALDPSARATVRRRLGADDETFVVGYFGFLNPSKGVPTLLEAFGKLVAGRPERSVRLALIGAETGVSNPTDLAQARAVHDAVEQERLGQAIVRTGYLDPPDLSATLLACDAIALPFLDGASARRGTLMAALAHGLPIVSTLPARTSPLAGPPAFWLGAGPAAVAVRDGVSILLVPPDDADALAAALLRLADDPSLRARLAAGRRGHRRRGSPGRPWPPRPARSTRPVHGWCTMTELPLSPRAARPARRSCARRGGASGPELAPLPRTERGWGGGSSMIARRFDLSWGSPPVVVALALLAGWGVGAAVALGSPVAALAVAVGLVAAWRSPGASRRRCSGWSPSPRCCRSR